MYNIVIPKLNALIDYIYDNNVSLPKWVLEDIDKSFRLLFYLYLIMDYNIDEEMKDKIRETVIEFLTKEENDV